MADLQEELQRFLTARFGVDVKDAFVSCIQKIHKENLDVVELEKSMTEAEQDLLTAKKELSDLTSKAIDAASEATQEASGARPSPERLRAILVKRWQRQRTPRMNPSMLLAMRSLPCPLRRICSRAFPIWNCCSPKKWTEPLWKTAICT